MPAHLPSTLNERRLSPHCSFFSLVINLFLTFPVPPKPQQTGEHKVQTAESQHHCSLTAWETGATSIPGNFCTEPANPEGVTHLIHIHQPSGLDVPKLTSGDAVGRPLECQLW